MLTLIYLWLSTTKDDFIVWWLALLDAIATCVIVWLTR